MGDSIWPCIAGIVFLGAGIWGLIFGGYTVATGGHRRGLIPPSGNYEYHLKGRGIPAVITVMGGLNFVIFMLGHVIPPKIPPSTADVICLIVFIVGIIASALVNLGHPERTTRIPIGPHGEALAVSHLTLTEAAKFLKMPENELLKMAKNGGIQARHVDGQYMFDQEVLEVVRDALRAGNN